MYNYMHDNKLSVHITTSHKYVLHLYTHDNVQSIRITFNNSTAIYRCYQLLIHTSASN